MPHSIFQFTALFVLYNCAKHSTTHSCYSEWNHSFSLSVPRISNTITTHVSVYFRELPVLQRCVWQKGLGGVKRERTSVRLLDRLLSLFPAHFLSLN